MFTQVKEKESCFQKLVSAAAADPGSDVSVQKDTYTTEAMNVRYGKSGYIFVHYFTWFSMLAVVPFGNLLFIQASTKCDSPVSFSDFDSS